MTPPAPAPARRAPLACVIINPAKPAATAPVRQAIDHALLEAGYGPAVWLETTPAEPGALLARAAVASGADLVLAAGGDGTVRAVAAGLAGTGVELGVVPIGTANLAARNLGLPVRDLRAVLDVASRGRARAVDLAWVRTGSPLPPAGPDAAAHPHRGAPPAEDPAPWARPTLGAEHACLVVTGIGFDAELVSTTRAALKARLAWGAYALAALGSLDAPHLEARVSVDGCEPELMRARCLLIANAGRLPAGITLLPAARMDDGVLDAAAIDTVWGLAGWASLARQVLPPFPARYTDPARSLGRVVLRRGQHVEVTVPTPAPVEIDGELLPPAHHVAVRLDPASVLVRTAVVP